jgi:glucose 1-dehydrogenase
MGTMHADFSGNVAFVTGAAGGMGRAVALAFARAGAGLVVTDVDERGGAQTAEMARAEGADAVFVAADVSDAAQIETAVGVALDRHGKLDCAVNAAAIENETAPLHDCSLEAFERMQAVNLRGVFLSMKYEIAAMLDGSGGAIVNTPMLRNAMQRRGRDADDVISRLSLIGRFGRPEEIAAAALWLCSDGASYVHGHPLAVDAGYLAR